MTGEQERLYKNCEWVNFGQTDRAITRINGHQGEGQEHSKTVHDHIMCFESGKYFTLMKHVCYLRLFIEEWYAFSDKNARNDRIAIPSKDNAKSICRFLFSDVQR